MDNQESVMPKKAEGCDIAILSNPAVEAEKDDYPLDKVELRRLHYFTKILQGAYKSAEELHAVGNLNVQKDYLGEELFEAALKLSNIKHAARGIALTLAAYKIIEPTQDIRLHKSEFSGGFSARSIDNAGTIPFLQGNSLSYNVESHWLSQTFSFAGPYAIDLILKTQPKPAGPLMIQVVNGIESAGDPAGAAAATLHVILVGLIEERNKGRIALEKPQNLSIDETIDILQKHFSAGYKFGAPRLPQIAIYAIYECIVPEIGRYKDLTLRPLERMKAANRKSGSVGDIDVNNGTLAFEAVEVKFDIPISREHVAEAIQKIKTASVQRYLILSTAGIAAGEIDEIKNLQEEFRRSNGCEIIINGVLDTIKYYLRLIDSPSRFISFYANRIEDDADLGYEHRLAWNRICATRGR